jgi:hypothetical protein
MISLSWAPIKVFKLHFGAQDQIYRFIENLTLDLKASATLQIYKNLNLDNIINPPDILRYVPQRLLRGFYSFETKGLTSDYLVNKTIINLSNETFNSSSPPIYRIDDEKELIEISKEWLEYFKANLVSINGWINFEWGNYLQKNNPNTPGILNKLSLSSKRTSLKNVKKLWDYVLEKNEINCIYTNLKLGNQFDLDHFLPWSFIAHDQFWNLVPASPEANLQKTNSIPSIEYINPLSVVHHKFINILKNHLDINSWKKYENFYIEGLGFQSANDIIKLESIEQAFFKTYSPLMQIAENIGFKANWKYEL